MSKSLVIFLVALAGSAFLLCSNGLGDVPSTNSGRELLTIIMETSSTRATFRGGPVSSRLCAANSNGTCDFISYAEAVGRMSIPALVMIPVCLVAFWSFCFGRFCCNCFGGWERTPGNVCYGQKCCGKSCYEAGEFAGYNNAVIWATRILLVLMAVALIAVMVPGFYGNNQVSKGVTGPTQDFIKFGIDTNTTVRRIVDRLSALRYTQNISSSMDAVYSALGTFVQFGKDGDGYVSMADNIRKPVYIALLVIAPFVALVGILGGIINVWKLTFSCSLILFWISTLIWLVFGIQYPMLIAVSDTCAEITIYNSNIVEARALSNSSQSFAFTPARTSVFEALVPVLSCSNSSFTDIKNQIDGAINSAYTTACGDNALDSLCLFSNTQYSQRVQALCGPANVTIIRNQPVCKNISLYNANNDINYCKVAADNAPGMTIADIITNGAAPPQCALVVVEQCVTDCGNSDARDLTNELVINLGLLKNYTQIFRDEVYPLLGCYFFAGLVSDLKNSVCDQLTPGANMVEQTFLSIGIVLIPTTILMILAAKRWRSDSFSGGGKKEADFEMRASSGGAPADASKAYNLVYHPTSVTVETSPPTYLSGEPEEAPRGTNSEYNPDHNPAYEASRSSHNPAYEASSSSHNPAHDDAEPEGEEPAPPPYQSHRQSVGASYNPEYSPEPERLSRPGTPPLH